MLRRRIFSAAMASVMALSTVAVVAQAEETTNQVVTKEQLEELITVTYGDAWRADKLSEYGSKSQEKMLDALEAADAILADAEADDDDYTVAAMMVNAVAAKLTIYNAEQLKALIDECQPIVDTNNIYNEELQDQRYDADTFGALEEALDYASAFVTSTSSSDITEAYEQLEAAKLGLKPLKIVSKTMFRNVLKKYEDIVASKYAYETWRRGTMTWTANISSGEFWKFNGNGMTTAAYGAYYDYILECRDTIVAAYDQIDAIKGLTKTTDVDIYAGYVLAQDAVEVFNTFAVDNVTKATKAGVQALLDKYHGQLVYEYAEANGTVTAQGIVDTIAALVAVEDDSSTDDDETANVGVTMYGPADADGNATLWNTATVWEGGNAAFWTAPSKSTTDIDNDTNTDAGTWKLVSAEAIVKLDTTVYVPVDADGYYITDEVTATRKLKSSEKTVDENGDTVINVTEDGATYNEETGLVEITVTPAIVVNKSEKSPYLKYQTISKNSKFDIAQLVSIEGCIDDSADLAAGDNDTMDYVAADGSGETNSWGAHAIAWEASDDFEGFDYSIKFSEAYDLAAKYLAGTYYEGAADGGDFLDDETTPNYINAIDTAGVAVAADVEAKGATKEWQLVYRYLYYALTEKYEGAVTADAGYTRADVKALIEDAWDLIDETGEAAIFNASNVALVEARKAAVEWVADANSDKLYKEYTSGTAADDEIYISSTDAYKDLNAAYSALLNEYNALKYSFGEIYDALAETAEMIDDGDLDATDDLLKAMDDVAYALSTVAPITVTTDGDEYEDNAAFDDIREFLENNRLVTWTDKDHAANIAQVAEDLEVEEAKVYCASDFNSTHYALLTAYDALNAAIAGQTESDDVLLGDANGDGAVTPADAAAILKWAVDLAEIDEKAADYNQDGAVTPADASAILKYCVQ